MIKKNHDLLAILGAGSWGTALALLLSRRQQDIRLWSRKKEHVKEMRSEGTNRRYLPDYPFPKSLCVYHDLKASLEGVHDILIVVPSFAFQRVLKEIKPYINFPRRIAWGTKGIALGGHLLHEVIETELGQMPVAALSGPSLATEVAAGLPTAITVASNDTKFAYDLIKRLNSPYFQAHQSNDLIGVEICGSVKSILAIVIGISDGLVLGANARAALITRGLIEMSRLVKVLGGEEKTLTGLAGLGDLVLTCTDNQSRNRRFGMALGKGVNRQVAEQSIGQAIEGLHNVSQVWMLAKRHKIDMPVIQQSYRIFHEDLDPRKAIQELFHQSWS
ncbi:NAD(P)H-dependent glycerol-3-phosphate dehydrogenase [Coxiella endosymbiont of Amblyomma americanum]|uniref:NAD(P)H-dependent glycerol-3-phosphate dehydrogenase n=1 Tax=Coxiella endosymbiont of Amblyomma americanum TaxID=325775 RepID=UPI00057CBCEB|nr:NAD(P)H-dependent glycerol-3-phosphate dehydrogenase [Coxiella endosymbiont of Amblyomma americanum]AJC50245.1 glycerol-3-phosphate dehydrogenase [NAD(P)+] [Coxiella endosymbiont of Amblyomma americanum]AUJ58604.1 glycerol-3-phosphate dehydrogenase [Coxiella-like endosymbiont of Amblyomma americanum]